MKKITEQFFCDVCGKETYHYETIISGIKPRDDLSPSPTCETGLTKNWEICENCYRKGKAIIKLEWKTTADDDDVGKVISVKHSIEI